MLSAVRAEGLAVSVLQPEPLHSGAIERLLEDIAVLGRKPCNNRPPFVLEVRDGQLPARHRTLLWNLGAEYPSQKRLTF